METPTNQLTPNSLAFIALCNEYCSTLENCGAMTPDDFTAAMLRLLPRIYISATDLSRDSLETGYIEPVMEEDAYNAVCSTISALLGEHDTYLEVFEEDMKYSDTPIAATISEGLTDLFQVFYNFVETVRDAPYPVVEEAIAAVAEDFRDYWSRILCNQLRALNNLCYSGLLENE